MRAFSFAYIYLHTMCTESIIDGRRGDLGRFPWEYRALATKDQPEQVGAFTDLFLYGLV